MADPTTPSSGIGKMLGGLKPSSAAVDAVEGAEDDSGGTPGETASVDAIMSAIETGDRKSFLKSMRALFDSFQAQQPPL